jgi:iron complex transport system substrate-binding protein
MRIVTHACSNTEIVAALGLGEAIVGTDDHSDFPPDVVARAARVGPDLHVDVERIVALRPDLVVYSLTIPGHERALAELQVAGLPVLVLEPVSLEDVYRDIRRVAEALGVQDRGEALVAGMIAAMPPVDPVRRPKVLVEWWPKPVIVPGRRSWVTDLIGLAGGINPFGDRDCKSTPVTDEEVAAVQPDAVVISWCGVPERKYRPDVVSRRPAWRGFPAVREGRIECVSEAFLGRPGPRLVDGYRALRSVVSHSPGMDPTG